MEFNSHIVKEIMLKISDIIVADTYFFKYPFVQGVRDLRFYLMSRFQNNASLRYLYKGETKKGRGSLKTYDGNVNLKGLNHSHFITFTYKNKHATTR